MSKVFGYTVMLEACHKVGKLAMASMEVQINVIVMTPAYTVCVARKEFNPVISNIGMYDM